MKTTSNRSELGFVLTTEFTESSHQHSLQNLVIGCVLNGRKYIKHGNECIMLQRGDVFYICKGEYMEINIPEGNHTYDEISAEYCADELRQFLNITLPATVLMDNMMKIAPCGNLGNCLCNDLYHFFKTQERAVLGFEFSLYPTLEGVRKFELTYLIYAFAGSTFLSILLHQLRATHLVEATICSQ